MLNTLFDPLKNTAGRALGVNWVWTVVMLVVHSWISIVVPILMAEALYPEKREEPWVTPRAFYGLLTAFSVDVLVLGHLLAPQNRPSWKYYVIEFLIVVACLLLARAVGGPQGMADPGRARSGRWFYIVGLLGTLVTLVGCAVVSGSASIPTALKITIMSGGYLVMLAFLQRNSAFSELSPFAKFSLASWVITFWLLVSPLMMVAKHDPGPIVVAIGMIVFLWKMRKRCFNPCRKQSLEDIRNRKLPHPAVSQLTCKSGAI